ncbi:DUF3617 family protein [Sphingosinicella sp. LHD-64]|uniref:DUF3617 domain-containing protein n=1 Tax=Sphingosinicella sp. LHD-64 TaxID=3072139 RepID=UPI00280C8B4F|nr:DUF3617 family protein [Sphingosinicella sp. LHD-64]MDQ8757295.1 DUF3617 family protein [Sphingosinicella sp. LHD-64]
MSNRLACLGLAALLVAGCGGGDVDGNATGNAGATGAGAQATFSGTLRPGRWAVAATGDVDGTEDLCITAEQVQRASFIGDALAEEPRCSVVRDRMAGGTIDVEVACGEGRHPMRMRGTYTAERFTIDSALEMPVGQGTETIRSQRTGRWVADRCAPVADAAEG